MNTISPDNMQKDNNILLPLTKEEIECAPQDLIESSQKDNNEAAEQALEEFLSLSSEGTSAYLGKKEIPGIGVRYCRNYFAVPMCDATGKLWSFQKIYSNGTKYFFSGGRIKGCFHTLGTLADGKIIYVVEGYATGVSVHLATSQTTVIAFSSVNIHAVIAELKKAYPKSPVIIAADNDLTKSFNTGKEKAEDAAKKWDCCVVLPNFKDLRTNPSDFNDLHVLEGLEEAKRQLSISINSSCLRALNLKDFLELEIPPREMVLNPIIPQQGLTMLYAPRGIGKTHVALSIAYTIALGTQMFNGKWKCVKPCKVLFVDGEMPASVLHDRLASIVARTKEELIDFNNLKIITQDLQESGIPDLSTSEGQQQLEEHLESGDLLILDNLSSLCRSGKENESESWSPIQEWHLKLRRKGISVLFVHHANKTGNQRGTSKKEDLLDTVIVLRRPTGYEPKEGARFEVHYEKARGFYGDEAKPFEVCLKEENGQIFWQVKELEDYQSEKIIELHKEGLKQREIAQELNIGLATVNRKLKKAKEGGDLND